MPPLFTTCLLPLPARFPTTSLAQWCPASSKNKPVHSLMLALRTSLGFVSPGLAAPSSRLESISHGVSTFWPVLRA